MPDKLEKLISLILRKSKNIRPPGTGDSHPDEEALACFSEGRLGPEESAQLTEHIASCAQCLDCLAINLRELKGSPPLPGELLERLKAGIIPQGQAQMLEIALRLKEKILEIINSTGDVLVGQELVPAAVLRSRSIKDFKDEVTILKDFPDLRVEVKIENKGSGRFNLIIKVLQKHTQEVVKDLRVSLHKDDLELESYQGSGSAVIFEHVLLGKYRVEVSNPEALLASVLLDIKT